MTTTTTRPPEEGEQASAEGGRRARGRHHFVSKEQFDAAIKEDKFPEHVERAAFVPRREEDAGGGDGNRGGNRGAEAPDAPAAESPEPFPYGVSREVEAARENGRVPVLDVDAAGVRALKKQFPEGASLCGSPPTSRR